MSDKIAEIRERHTMYPPTINSRHSFIVAYQDIATLLAEVDRLSSDLRVQQGCCDGAAAQDAHVRREREEHRAEVEKLREDIERLTGKEKSVDYIDRLIRKRMAEAWEEGWFDRDCQEADWNENPYRERTEK